MPERRARTSDRLLDAAAWGAAALVTLAFAWILGGLILRGSSALSWEFLVGSPQNAGRDGGIAPILVSTLLILLVCLAVSVPIGVATAALLAEFSSGDSAFGKIVRRSLDALAAVPSIVFGLFGNVFFCQVLGMGFSILSGGLTLACMVLPLFIRTVEEGFRSVPSGHRMAAAALGYSRGSMVFRLILPLATPGIVVGLILGVGRALAETAALIFTSGYVDRMPGSLMDSGRALSIHIYDLSMNIPGGEANAHGSALVLIVMLIAINQAASWGARRFLHRNVMYA